MAKTTPPKVFFDANVLYSGLHSPAGAPAQVIALHSTGKIRMVLSALVLSELIRTVQRKLPERLLDLHRFLSGSRPEVMPNPTRQDLHAYEELVNPKDAPIIAAAMAANVDYLVSGDSRFIEETRRVPGAPLVVTPRQLLDHVSAAGNSP